MIVIGLVIVIGTLAAIQMLSVSPLWSEKGAAWVQAFGSIAAILGAFAVAARQHKDSVQRDRDTNMERIAERQRAVATVVAHCFAMIYGLPPRRSGREEYEVHIKHVPRSTFTNLRERLKEAPIYEIPNREVVTCALFMMEHMDKTIAMMERLDALSAADREAQWQWIIRNIQHRRTEAWHTHQRLKQAIGDVD